MTIVSRPGSSSLVPTTVSGARPVPIGTSTHDDGLAPSPGTADLVPSTIKTYRRHNCERRHRTYRALAQCMWRRAVWVTGEGPYATLARCRVLTVELHATYEAAKRAMGIIDWSGCGGACPCTGAGHDLVRLVDPTEAITW